MKRIAPLLLAAIILAPAVATGTAALNHTQIIIYTQEINGTTYYIAKYANGTIIANETSSALLWGWVSCSYGGTICAAATNTTYYININGVHTIAFIDSGGVIVNAYNATFIHPNSTTSLPTITIEGWNVYSYGIIWVGGIIWESLHSIGVRYAGGVQISDILIYGNTNIWVNYSNGVEIDVTILPAVFEEVWPGYDPLARTIVEPTVPPTINGSSNITIINSTNVVVRVKGAPIYVNVVNSSNVEVVGDIAGFTVDDASINVTIRNIGDVPEKVIERVEHVIERVEVQPQPVPLPPINTGPPGEDVVARVDPKVLGLGLVLVLLAPPSS